MDKLKHLPLVDIEYYKTVLNTQFISNSEEIEIIKGEFEDLIFEVKKLQDAIEAWNRREGEG